MSRFTQTGAIQMHKTSKTALLRRLLIAALFGISLSAEAATVYVPLGSANSIAVIDTGKDKVVATIPGVLNAHALSVTPDGKTLVAGSIAERPAGAPPPRPKGVSEEEHRAHHAPSASAAAPAAPGTLYLIDAKTKKIVQQIDVPGGIHHEAVTPDGRYAISTHPSRGSISVVDIAQRKLLHTIATGPVPNYAVVTHDGRRVYVSNAGNDTVSEIDTSHWIVKRNFVVGKAPEHLLLSADEHRLYVNNVASGTVAVLDLDKGDVARTYSVGRAPHGLDLSDHGTTLFVSAQKDDKLVAIDLGSGAIKALPLAPAPYHVLAVRGQEKLYISSRKQPKIWVVDTKQFKVKGEIKIQGEGHQMALVP